jgi:hypothetical protein
LPLAGSSAAAYQRHRAVEFRNFLAQVEQAVPADLDIHLVLDNYATHKAPPDKAWLTRHPRYHVHSFAALKPIHIAVLLLLIRKHNGHNNGANSLGLREVVNRCHCSQATAWRVLKTLQQAHLVSMSYKGHLVPEVGRPHVATRWRLNFVVDAPKLTHTSIPEFRVTSVPK